MKENELAEFLMNNPECIPYQRALDAALSEINTPEERMQYLSKLMTENLHRLRDELIKLQRGIKCLKE